MTAREPEWDEKERAKILAYLDYEAQVCTGCGGYLPETTDEQAKYTAEPPFRCYRCDAIQSQQEAYKDNPNPGALVLWPAEKR